MGKTTKEYKPNVIWKATDLEWYHWKDFGQLYFFFFFFLLFRAALEAYGGSQARGRIGAVAAGLHHSHSHAGSEPPLQPTPQFMAMLDPQPTE